MFKNASSKNLPIKLLALVTPAIALVQLALIEQIIVLVAKVGFIGLAGTATILVQINIFLKPITITARDVAPIVRYA